MKTGPLLANEPVSDTEPLVTARIGGHPVRIHQPLRPRVGEVGTVHLGLIVHLSAEDILAVLLTCNLPREDLADDEFLRETVAETVLNRGCGTLEEWRCDWRHGVPHAWDEDADAYVAYCQQRVGEVFGTTPAPR